MTMPQNFGRLSSNYHLWCPPLWLKNLEGINKRLRIRERERERDSWGYRRQHYNQLVEKKKPQERGNLKIGG